MRRTRASACHQLIIQHFCNYLRRFKIQYSHSKDIQHKFRLTLFIVLSSVLLCSAAVQPGEYRLDTPPQHGARLPSNSIIDIVPAPDGRSIWFGTGRGLGQIHLPGAEWSVINESSGLGRGGVSALVVSDSVIWAATAYTEEIRGEYYPAGGGVGYSRDEGVSWRWMRQPVDSADVTDYSPTTTNIQNVTYDIAVTDSAVWIVSWGGGLRKLRHGSDRWELVTVDGNSFKPLQYLSHRVFSAAYDGRSLWVGSAAGVHHSEDGGYTWAASSAGAGSISGNFVVALGVQYAGPDTLIWAATWRAERNTEYYGVSVTADHGASWRVALSDSTRFISGPYSGAYLIDIYGSLRAHNFGFKDSTVYVCADGGLWFSDDLGRTWDWAANPIHQIADWTINERLDNPDFYSAAAIGDTLWIGTDNGLAFYHPSLLGWRILRAHQPAGVAGQPNTYAYPSPFSPRRGHQTRFQFRAAAPGDGVQSWGVWNFAMEPVIEFSGPYPANVFWGGGTGMMAGYGAVAWDGRDAKGKIVANGVYFYRLKVNGKDLWGKVMVID